VHAAAGELAGACTGIAARRAKIKNREDQIRLMIMIFGVVNARTDMGDFLVYLPLASDVLV
jgi:hypothetical protein